MSKFKPGDKVSYIGSWTRGSFTRGKEYTVGGKYHEVFAKDRCGVVEDDEGDENGLPDSNFVLVEEDSAK